MLEDEQKVGMGVFVRPLIDPILAFIWSLFLICFMLNLVELGSNYLPLIHFVPKMHFVLLSRETRGFWQKRGPLEAVLRKMESQTKPQRSDENKAEHRTSVHQWSGPRTAVHPTVLRRTAGRASWHGRASGPPRGFAFSRAILCSFASFLRGLLGFFWEHFREKIRV